MGAVQAVWEAHSSWRWTCCVNGHLMEIDSHVGVVVTFSLPSLYQRPSAGHGYVRMAGLWHIVKNGARRQVSLLHCDFLAVSRGARNPDAFLETSVDAFSTHADGRKLIPGPDSSGILMKLVKLNFFCGLELLIISWSSVLKSR